MQEQLLPDHDKHAEVRRLMDKYLELPHLLDKPEFDTKSNLYDYS